MTGDYIAPWLSIAAPTILWGVCALIVIRNRKSEK